MRGWKCTDPWLLHVQQDVWEKREEMRGNSELLEEGADLGVRRKALCELLLVDGAVLLSVRTQATV